jgi:hypothetical protein
MRATTFTLLLTLAASIAYAQSDKEPPAKGTTYTGVGQHGEKVFSDQPLPGGKTVEVSPPQTYKAPPAPRVPSTVQTRAAPFRYTVCNIASPAHDTALVNPDIVVVTARIEPMLRSGDTVSITMDGTQISSSNSTVRVKKPQRGTHSLAVTIRDESGATICTSAPAAFHVRLPTVNQVNRNANKTTTRRP